MGWQERERHVSEALLVLGKRQREGKRSRIHKETREGWVARRLALERNCGRCQSLIIKITSVKRIKKRVGVGLKCRSGRSPLEFHREYIYNPGETPSCPSLIPFKQEE